MSVASITETGQYLTFKLDSETFAIDISRVREVLEFKTVTKVPQTPDFMLGVINLRGSVVPVVDMRLKFGMSGIAVTVNTCIIIVEMEFDGETAVLGASVDSVQEVLELAPDQISPPPRIGERLNNQVIKAMGHHGAQFIMIFDMDKVFSAEELAAAQEMGVETPTLEEVAV
jgi:purine-binding chemotaxis protein CheW